MKKRKILLGLTTITKGEWKNKIKEIDELGLKEVALFLTCLNFEQRRELYRLLEKTGLERIPHAHLRDDMTIDELDYLTDKYAVEVFNEHSENDNYPSAADYKNYLKKIYVENTVSRTPTEKDLKKYAGLCFDLSHWQSLAMEQGESSPENERLKKLGQKYKIGVNHVSAIKRRLTVYHDGRMNKNFCSYDDHFFSRLNEFAYVKKYEDYLADIISIELENPLKEQLAVKKYLEKILDL